VVRTEARSTDRAAMLASQCGRRLKSARGRSWRLLRVGSGKRKPSRGRFQLWLLPIRRFFLRFSFDSSVAPVGRILASLTGLLTLLAALHFLGKHTFNFDMYEAVIERERSNLGLPRASRNHLLADVHSFPLTLALCSASG
jgi:hypothetical protein